MQGQRHAGIDTCGDRHKRWSTQAATNTEGDRNWGETCGVFIFVGQRRERW